MRTNSTIATLVATAMLAWTSCGGEGEIGDECGAEGEDGECVEEAVCGKSKEGSEVLLCLKVCDEQSDCAADEDCNGVEGLPNIKGCRPRDSSSSGPK